MPSPLVSMRFKMRVSVRMPLSPPRALIADFNFSRISNIVNSAPTASSTTAQALSNRCMRPQDKEQGTMTSAAQLSRRSTSNSTAQHSTAQQRYLRQAPDCCPWG